MVKTFTNTNNELNLTLTESVFNTLKNAIVNGDLTPGSKLSEAEIAKAYGISRGPLREAIGRLEGQKLVKRMPHVGASVINLNAIEIIELYQIRETLEAMAAEQAAKNMSSEQINDLFKLLELHQNEPNFKSGLNYYQQEGDFDFHYHIIQGSGNSTLFNLLCNELYHLVRMYRLQFAATPNRPHQAFIEHQRITEALAERDGELAAILMKRHIATSRRNIERYYQLTPN